jgi:hypothetical protein
MSTFNGFNFVSVFSFTTNPIKRINGGKNYSLLRYNLLKKSEFVEQQLNSVKYLQHISLLGLFIGF